MNFRISLKIKYGLGFLVILLLISCQSGNPDFRISNGTLPDLVDFNFHIKPILSDRCFACHGPDEKARKADLRLDLESEALSVRDSIENRYAILPGDLRNSELVDRIESDDPEYMMPPPTSNLKLSDDEKELIKKWIKQGADWKPHWAFMAPQKPDVPKVKKSKWPVNAIDNFTLVKMESKGLKPAREADKTKLIRRLYFDLTGLPPGIEEIDTFLFDDASNAYEKLVDKVLSKETFGERMAMEWMDLARYADSHGYQDDLERSMWPWRDWVIQAFNDNMPYNQFVSWQVAGDLLPESTYEQKLATGFNRNHKITQEVGVIDEEYRVTYVLDRVNTFSTAFLGLTIECAQCHDHKYDPITQKDYYRLFGFFNNVPEKGRVDYGVEVAEPSIPLPQAKVEEIKKYINSLFEDQKQKVEAYIQDQDRTDLKIIELGPTRQMSTNSIFRGMTNWYPFDYVENNKVIEVVTGKSADCKNDLIPVQGKYSGGLEFMGQNYASLDPANTFNLNQAFSIGFWIKSLDGGISGPIISALGGAEKTFGFRLQVGSEKRLRVQFNNQPQRGRIYVLGKKTIPENVWTYVTVTYDGSGKAKGVHLYLDGELLDNYVLDDNLRGTLPPVQNIYLGVNNPNNKRRGLVAGQLDEIMFFNKKLGGPQILELVHYNPLPALMAKREKNISDRKRLLHHQLLHADEKFQTLTERLREYRIRQGRTDDIILKPTMVMADMDTVRPTFVLDRGMYDAPGERVEPGTPESVLIFDENYPRNRLGLANWLFNPQNPLTARVAVNRFWQMLFGLGIVGTPGDFGNQGSLPSHPKLLDWLAVEFQASGWDMKRLLKIMVLSATYRQSVETNPRLQQKDPENIYLARGPNVRLPAEMVRDNALMMSGLLSQRVGGPSVKPYQPPGLWLEVASGNQSLRKYIQDHDHDLYRRSLYSFWKRTIPPPSMTIFDAPSREQCTIKRRATNTPMQALVILNDPQFLEASRVLAARMLTERGPSAVDRISFAFKLATSRAPKANELSVLQNLLKEELSHFRNRPEQAKKLISIGEYRITEDLMITELAAYTVVAHAIINLTEAIQKG